MITFSLILTAALLATSIPLFADHSPHKNVVVMLGPPGAGKGTQAIRLSQELSLPHISTGDLFRLHLKSNSPLGQKARGYMEAGDLVPDALVLDMLFDRVSQPDCSPGFILDGFPRTVPQAEALIERLDTDTDLRVVSLDIPDETIVKRMAERRVCGECGAPYSLSAHPPKQEGVCDKCGGALIVRKDDQESVVRSRLDVYHAQTAPVIAHFEKDHQVEKVDATQTMDTISERLISTILRRS